ncbi:histidine kinase [Nesterenkonia alba]|uniref:histidine kinase n=1 Tax=Nesterenkonia alba TaxID=515814 RepID=UPI0003B3EC9A|nr:histidine kinase [Nesterenkonia alba]
MTAYDPAAEGDALTGRDAVRSLAAAGRSVPLRAGLTAEAARRTAELVRPMLSGDAVTITDTADILAFVGPGEDHHRVGGAMQTEAAARAVRTGSTVVVADADDLGCRVPGCPLVSAVIAPLYVDSRVVGTLGVFQARAETPPVKLVEDMASVLSLHLELAELDRAKQLATAARLDALRAQISPHFLFNILNTIASKARTSPEEARGLIRSLSDFFRHGVHQRGHFAPLRQECDFVRTYLSLEQARFGARLRTEYDVDPTALSAQVPVLAIQPLVENAVKHGIAPKKAGGTVRLSVRREQDEILVEVADDGVGMAAELAERVLDSPEADYPGDPLEEEHAGVGLPNIAARLETLYGSAAQMRLTSGETGTTVRLRLPAEPPAGGHLAPPHS